MLLLAVALVCAASGCASSDEACAPEGTIVAGRGVAVGDKTICIGQSVASVKASLGAWKAGRDLGSVGVGFSYPTLKISGLFSGSMDSDKVSTIFVDAGADTKTAKGVTVGSTDTLVKGEFGDPAIDPFVQAWWYRKAGIAFQWDGTGAVRRIQISAPATASPPTK